MASKPAPSVSETLPVTVEPSFAAAQAEAARQLLDDVPRTFDSDLVPNGAIRKRLNYLNDSAREQVREIEDAPTTLERLWQASRARPDAREVRATWRAIDSDLTRKEVREETPEIRATTEEFASRWSYIGDDPVRALRVHAEIESDLVGARNWAASDGRDHRQFGDGPFGVGEAASRLERARVDNDVMNHMFDRFQHSLETTSDLKPRLETARRTLYGRVQRRIESLPDVDADLHESPSALLDRNVGDTAGVWALARLYQESERNALVLRNADDPEPALARRILEATAVLVTVRAFDRLRSRIENGDEMSVESAEAVVALRENALEAIEAARTNELASGLVRELLPQFARYVRWTDEEFANQSGAISVRSVERDVADYIVAAETCRVLPAVASDTAKVVREP